MKLVVATMLLLMLSISAGTAAVVHVDAVDVAVPSHSVHNAVLDAHSGQDGQSGHDGHRDYCVVSIMHCGVSYLSTTTVANVHGSARRSVFLLADDQLLAGCLHEAQTPPPRS